MTPRGALVRSGGSTRRDAAGALIAAELRLQAAQDEARDLRRSLLRLRSAVATHLEHPCPESCTLLRYELGRRVSPYRREPAA